MEKLHDKQKENESLLGDHLTPRFMIRHNLQEYYVSLPLKVAIKGINHTILAASSKSSHGNILIPLLAIKAFASSTFVPKKKERKQNIQ